MHRGKQRDEPHDAQRSGNRQAADDDRQTGRDHTAEDEEQHYRDQRQRQHFHSLLILGDGAGQLAGHRLQPGELHLAVVHILQIGLDGLEIGQDFVIVVTLEGQRNEGSGLVVGGELADGLGVGSFQVAGPRQHLVGVIGDVLVQFADDLLRPFRVVDGLALGSSEHRNYVAGPVAAVHLVGQHRRLHRFAAVIEEAALGDVLPKSMLKTPPSRHSATMTAMTMYRKRYTIRPHQANT